MLNTKYEKTERFLMARVTGGYTLEGVRTLFSQLAEEVDRSGRSRLFLRFEEVEGGMPDIDRYELGVHAGKVFHNVERLAILSRADAGSTGFFEDTAQNRGVPVRVVQDEKAALDWLTAP